MFTNRMNQAKYATHRGVSRKTVTGWKQRGLIVFTEGQKVDVAASDKLLLDHGILLPGVTDSDADDTTDPDQSMRAEAARLVSADGQALWSKADAEKVKENYAARLKQLEYDREMGMVVEIDDVVIAVAAEYSLIRNKLLGIGSKVAPEASVLDSAEEIKALIDKQVVSALKGLTIDGHGERDFETLRGSIEKRFGGTTDEDQAGAAGL